MSTPNAPELRRVLAHVEANQDRWHQGAWRIALADLDGPEDQPERCGTAFCFAGWKCELDGVTWKQAIPTWSGGDAFGDERDMIVMPTGGVISAERYARKAFGLTREQADLLFDPENELDDLRRIVAELCTEAEQVTP